MWMKFETDKRTSFAKVHDRATVGSALSNHIILPGKGVKPLIGQFVKEDNSFAFRDFLSKQVFSMDEHRELSFGDWRAGIVHSSKEDEILIPATQEAFRKFVGENSLSGPERENLMRRFLKMHFLNSTPPEEAQKWIDQHQREVHLESPVEHLLQDSSVTDILVNAFDEIYVERRNRLERSFCQFSSPEGYQVYLENLLSKQGLQFSPAKACLSFSHSEGVRAHLIGPPLTYKNYYFSLRRASPEVWRLHDLKERDLITDRQVTLIKEAIQKRRNLLVSGGTGTGKTTLLKSILMEIPAEERVLLAEDTPEVALERPNFLRLLSSSPAGSLEKPGVQLQHLIKEALRMRPDRLFIGEVRGEEAFDLLMALNVGHRGCVSTLHANSARDALWRFQSLIRLHRQSLSEESVRELVSRNIDQVIHIVRDPAKNTRKVEGIFQIRGLEKMQFILEQLDA